MQKLKENRDLVAIAAILLAFVMLFIWIKIYPTIEDPLIEDPDDTWIIVIDLFEDAERAKTWRKGDNLTDDMEKSIIEMLSSMEIKKSFDVGKGQSLDDTNYCIMLFDGNTSKTIWFGNESFCRVDNEGLCDIVTSDDVVAETITELDALLAAA